MEGWRLLWREFWSRDRVPPDGFGQSMAEDIRFHYRFWRCWNRPVVWRAPADEERQRYDTHAIIERFGDFTEAVTEVEGRSWVVRSRAFFGWPDAPEFVLFVVDADGAIWCAADFNQWPQGWKRPEPENTKLG